MTSKSIDLSPILDSLRGQADPSRLEGMARYGISTDKALGLSIPILRAKARELKAEHGKSPALAQSLWATGIHEIRILASMVDDPTKLTTKQMEEWTTEFNSWDLCDQVCANLYEKSPLAWAKAVEWAEREPEFTRRAGFVLMARLAVSAKKSSDHLFDPFFPLIEKYATDPRNFVKKAVNWALRQMGKRCMELNARARDLAEKLKHSPDKAARWIGSDAWRELTDPAVLGRIKR